MSVTINSSYISNPETVAQGGTGANSFTAYSLLASGTGTTTAWQSAGTGSANQVYVSGGAASLGAWTNQNQVGAWVMLSSQTASSSANISFTGLSNTYAAYKVVIAALTPATNGTNLQLLVSSNNGSSYDNAAGNYRYAAFLLNDTGAASTGIVNSASATNIQIGNTWSNTAFANNLEVTLVNPATSLLNQSILFFGKYNDSTSSSAMVLTGMGQRIATQVNNAIRFQMSSGNIASGVLKLYGMLA